jgi:dTDP-4-dehydrorhamnose reductase
MIGLLGSSGYVGSRFRWLFETHGVAWRPIRRPAIFDAARLSKALVEANVQFVVNCAGFTGKPNVDACETQKSQCLLGNAVLPGVVREACESLDLPWGHVSSGCIYTGRRADGSGFREEDPPNFSFRQNNCSFYSGTKALGEEVLVGAAKCYIWRLRIPFDSTTNPRNYLQKVLTYDRLLEAENSLSRLDEFVQACLDCYQKRLRYGVYNITNPGSVWTSEVTALLRASGITDKPFEFFCNEQEFMRTAAKAPRSNCVLDSTKAVQAGLKLTPIVRAIEECLSAWPCASQKGDLCQLT